VEVIIAGAGGAAHLAGVIAAHTILPVIGVPMESGFMGLDSLLSTVQMPGGVPVATVAIGKAGARNAGILAVQILSGNRRELKKSLVRYKASLAAKVAEAAQKIKRQP
jgi:phosphoribosylaminoimidazole carboxylase PurE protein